MGVNIVGPTGPTILEVDPVSKAVRSSIYDVQGNLVTRVAGALTVSESSLTVGGVSENIARPLRLGTLGATAQARETLFFQDLVDGATVNTQQWTQVLTTQTAVQGSRIVTLNAGNSVAITTTAGHVSVRQFAKTRNSILHFSARVRFNWTSVGAAQDLGFGAPAGTTLVIPNGYFLRVDSAGDLRIVRAFNSVEFQTSSLAQMQAVGGIVDPSAFYDVDLYVIDDQCRLLVRASDSTGNDNPVLPVIDATFAFASGQIAEWQARAVPCFLRNINVAATTTANQLIYSGVTVSSLDQDTYLDFEGQLSTAGRNTTLNPASGAQLTNWANTAAPVTGTPSNTAAGYTTLGGQWQIAAPTGAETDLALFAFTVPAGYQLKIRRVRIGETCVFGAASATTPTLIQWFIDRAAAVTLATNSFRRALGSQSIPVGTAIGGCVAGFEVTFPDGFVVDSGQVCHIAFKIPVGTATASEILRGTVDVDGVLI